MKEAGDWNAAGQAQPAEVEPGTLYLVSTPIGNLRDISLRALDVLAAVDLIAAEDTRTSRILLQHYAIPTPLTSYHDHNEERAAPLLVQKLVQGASIALISDAGTPGISDPGFYLVRAALQAGCRVVAVPGATAFVPALIASGLPAERFVFEGFLPHKKGRQTRLQALREEPRTMIFYESPLRLERLLREVHALLGDRPAAIAREVTKKFEEIRRGTLAELIAGSATLVKKGEFVVMVAGRPRNSKEASE
ncbi:MAG TPA: 16S rRNA (cytidine(1402)-2'-O)-methyltransferase [bacterium]|nr:16S rRNA (cytidine(1402)-2'-O)-methyltransferase [bacterium]HQG46188.1 16S rRNA (cytidine(1402)-2'-O)-methyltransferase [bacterium]HQI49207.1 16S rRNA (cytidine(1402)-2'-O)-methyltransferase [bacterium]HQJ64300.1 16S rRNA (cytidine(1402)-2'-O)-methyltransferase [bacterium]